MGVSMRQASEAVALCRKRAWLHGATCDVPYHGAGRIGAKEAVLRVVVLAGKAACRGETRSLPWQHARPAGGHQGAPLIIEG